MYINWRDGVTPISELTLENFRDFADAYAEYTYLLCYKATLDERQAASASVHALCRVISRESAKDGSENVLPEEGIKAALRSLLNKAQLANLYNDIINPGADKIPKPELCDAIVNKAVDKAMAEMPRYAPVVSGTKGALVIIGIVTMILVTVLLVWTNPFSCAENNGNKSNASSVVDPAGRPNSELLVDISCQAQDKIGFNCGALPVLVSVNGPDAYKIKNVKVCASDGTELELFEYGSGKYCFMAQNPDTYLVEATDGETVIPQYKVIADVKGTDDENAPFKSFVSVSHNSAAFIVLPSDYQTEAAPEKGTLEITAGGFTYTPDGTAGSVGLDVLMFNVGGSKVYKMPVIISNTSPVVDMQTLYSEVVHTPTNRGSAAGHITAEDADSDALTFVLTSYKNCSVMLSPNGGYIALIDENYNGEEAYFCFTVSDGLITTNELTCSFDLKNQLITETEFEDSFVCYSGEDGYYELELPMTDLDGDPLSWRLVTENENGRTLARGSEVLITEDGIKYRIDPALNEDFTELLEFSCNDGWKSSGIISYLCHVTANKPAVDSGLNYGTMSIAAESQEFTVSVSDDCPFDKYIITSIGEVYGGTVKEGLGWSDMKFTFVPDDSVVYCYAYITITDLLTEQTITVRYDITRG